MQLATFKNLTTFEELQAARFGIQSIKIEHWRTTVLFLPDDHSLAYSYPSIVFASHFPVPNARQGRPITGAVAIPRIPSQLGTCLQVLGGSVLQKLWVVTVNTARF